MNGNVHTDDPWASILTRLLISTSGLERNAPARAAHRLSLGKASNEHDRHLHTLADGAGRSARIVNVLDRLSERTVTVSWRDSTSCHYNDQIWRVGIARQPGWCAISGMRIETGDAIYRPIPTFPAPVNAQEMILASAILRAGTEG